MDRYLICTDFVAVLAYHHKGSLEEICLQPTRLLKLLLENYLNLS
jgi:hypothetical protein